MKLVIRSAIFHLFCIIIFSVIYFYSSHEFHCVSGEKTFMDCLLLSTTIQAGVGISDLYPTSIYSKLFVILQQIILILTHLITLYIFTL